MNIYKKGFSLIELMVVLLIIGGLLIFAVDQYLADIEYVRFKRALVDLEEIAKTIRVYNIREEKPFPVATFTEKALGNLIGTYFERVPPLDPWSRPYRHFDKLGVVYSVGKDGIDNFLVNASESDDIVVWYLPRGFYLTKAEYIDANQNNSVDFGDLVEIYFSRPAKISNDVTTFDFITTQPSKALRSGKVVPNSDGRSLRIILMPPENPTLIPGETKVKPRPFLQSILDYSTPPNSLDSQIEVTIQRRKL